MEMTGYTKLFGSIVASTIWREPHETRIVWITMLALANKIGIVEASIPGLADLARVTIPECEGALAALQSPDHYSRTKDHDGRRIEPVDGGWAILNHAKYRAKMGVDERREYLTAKKREERARDKVNTTSTNVNNGADKSTPSTHAEAAPDAKAEAPTPKSEEGKAGFSEGKDSRLLPTTPQAQRIATLFSRRFTTAWSEGEVRAYKKIGNVSESDLDLIERYYSRERARGDDGKHRRDLGTFLNNFTGELDRARAAMAPRAQPAARQNAPDPEGWREWLTASGVAYIEHWRAMPGVKTGFEKREGR